jgi:hypothetical protein
VNSTVADNFVSGIGGGILLNGGGVLLITNSTIARNRATFIGGGIANLRGGTVPIGTVLLQNTILALNTEGPGLPSDCSGPVTSLDNNLIGVLTGCTITLQPSDLTGDPGLDTFTDNGTPGNGHFPLLLTSQAIDAGNDAVCPRRDQLGERRIGPCDIGAIEFQDQDDHDQNDRHDEEDSRATTQEPQ